MSPRKKLVLLALGIAGICVGYLWWGSAGGRTDRWTRAAPRIPVADSESETERPSPPGAASEEHARPRHRRDPAPRSDRLRFFEEPEAGIYTIEAKLRVVGRLEPVTGGAQVDLRGPGFAEVQTVKTDAAGRFVFEEVPAGHYQAPNAGFAQALRYYVFLNDPRLAPAVIHDVEPGLATEFVLPASEGGSVRVRVLDRGQPVPKARVRLLYSLDVARVPAIDRQLWTDPLGWVEFSRVAPGLVHSLAAYPRSEERVVKIASRSRERTERQFDRELVVDTNGS
jgi:hypothetical protein